MKQISYIFTTVTKEESEDEKERKKVLQMFVEKTLSNLDFMIR